MKMKFATIALIAGILAMVVIPVIATSPLSSPADHSTIGASPSWPGLTRVAPVVVASDADFPLQGFSGSGTAIDPWVLDGVLIECNGTGSGISIANTVEYAVIRNSFINESGGSVPAFDSGILLNNADNVVIQNVTVEEAGLSNVAVAYSENVNFTGCTTVNATMMGLVLANSTSIIIGTTLFDDNAGRDLEISASFNPNYDITIDNCTFTSYITASNVIINKVNGLAFTNNNCQNNNTLLDGAVHILTSNGTVAGNFIGTLGNLGDVGIHIESAGNMLVENNTISDFLDQALIIGKSDLSINGTCMVRNNTIVGSFTSGIAKGISDLSNYSTFIDNMLVNLSYGFSIEGANHAIYANNTFNNNVVSIRVMDIKNLNLTFTGNNFTDTTLLWSPAITIDSERIFTGNWIDVDAFNSTGIIYPTVDWVFDQNYYRDYFDRFPNAVTDNVSTNILEYEYELTPGINDTRAAYYPAWFPRGETEIVFYIYSSIDSMGITYEWFKLYVDSQINARQFASPGNVLYRVTVRDFASRVLYDRMHNVNASDSVEIGLAITTLIIQNEFDEEVLFQLTRGGVTTTFAIAAGESISLRVITGTYGYRVTDMSGRTLRDEDNDYIVGSKALAGPGVITFGWVSVPEPSWDTINNYSSNVLDYAVVIGMLGAGFAITLVLVTRVPKRVTSKAPPTRRRTH